LLSSYVNEIVVEVTLTCVIDIVVCVNSYLRSL